MQILERMSEPDRVVMFRVPWTDDKAIFGIRGDTGFSSTTLSVPIRGLRFHPSVNLSVLKFLGLSRPSKTTLPASQWVAARVDRFQPKGKSDNEVMRFCQSFMTELHRHIGEDTDVPAGDIGVGAREIGFMFGQYKRIENKLLACSLVRVWSLAAAKSVLKLPATARFTLCRTCWNTRAMGCMEKPWRFRLWQRCNVCVQKVNHLVGKVVTLSDSSGFIHDPDGISAEKLEFLIDLKHVRRGRIGEYAEQFKSASFHEGRPWGVPCDLALPCATQNEINGEEARTLVSNGCGRF